MGRAALQADGLRLEEAMQALEGQGFFTVFGPARGGRILCLGCGQETAAEEARVEAQHRVEGGGDPADNRLVLGLRCSGCNDRGTLVLPFGPGAGRDEVAVLRALRPMRRAPGPPA